MVNVKRAALLALISYAFSLAGGFLAAYLMGVEVMNTKTPTSVWIAGIFTTIIIAGLFTWIYFRDPAISPSGREGLQFALVLFIVSFLLDLMFIIPVMLTGMTSVNIIAYYTNPFFWVIVLVLFATCTFVGQFLQKRAKGMQRTSSATAESKTTTDKPMKKIAVPAVKKSSSKQSKKKSRR